MSDNRTPIELIEEAVSSCDAYLFAMVEDKQAVMGFRGKLTAQAALIASVIRGIIGELKWRNEKERNNALSAFLSIVSKEVLEGENKEVQNV